MALNIKNPEVERLAAEIALATGESKTEAIRRSLLERKARLLPQIRGLGKKERLQWLLRQRIWPAIPPEVRGKTLTKAEREEILGYGPGGV